jgi:aminoglycoside 3-N-acetyltransferase
MIKKIIRIIVRKLLYTRERETIRSAMDRHFVRLKKIVYKKKITQLDLKEALEKLDINIGDNLMVHSAWRQFFNFSGNPDDVIKVLQDIIGEEGTILMPSYGPGKKYFDVENSPSEAGVLSEVFRKQDNIYRSACTHFSVCGKGPLAYEITKDHIKSEYGFDSNSPCYKFSQLEKSKLLFMGLGSKPTKISLFHCAGYMLMDEDPHLKEILSDRYNATLIVDGNKYEKSMVIRKPGHGNNNSVFKRIYSEIRKKNHIKISNLDLVIIDANEGLNKAVDFAKRGIYCYK